MLPTSWRGTPPARGWNAFIWGGGRMPGAVAVRGTA